MEKEKNEIEKKPILLCKEMSVKTRVALRNFGVITVSELLDFSEEELLADKRIPQVIFEEIRGFLTKNNLALKGDLSYVKPVFQIGKVTLIEGWCSMGIKIGK